MGIVDSNVRAHGRAGHLQTEVLLLTLMTPLRHTMFMWLETRCIIDRLRVTKTHARLNLLRSRLNRPTIRVRMDMLSVDIGLLYMTTPGCNVRLWVTLTCRCRLLENRRGQ